MTAVIRSLALLALVWGLNACSLLPAPQPTRFYRLPPTAVTPSPAPKMAWTLRISRPAASDLLASSRILVVPEGDQLSAYQGARWSSPAPILWRERLMEAFIADGRIRHVSSDGDSLQADVELGGSLRAFQSEYQAGRPVVVIRLDAHLVETASRHILASHRFEAREPPQGSEVPAVVKAFGLASDRLARALIDWTLAQQRE